MDNPRGRRWMYEGIRLISKVYPGLLFLDTVPTSEIEILLRMFSIEPCYV